VDAAASSAVLEFIERRLEQLLVDQGLAVEAVRASLRERGTDAALAARTAREVSVRGRPPTALPADCPGRGVTPGSSGQAWRADPVMLFWSKGTGQQCASGLSRPCGEAVLLNTVPLRIKAPPSPPTHLYIHATPYPPCPPQQEEMAAGEAGRLHQVMVALARPTRLTRGKEIDPSWSVQVRTPLPASVPVAARSSGAEGAGVGARRPQGGVADGLPRFPCSVPVQLACRLS
jgi:hypothetical protein